MLTGMERIEIAINDRYKEDDKFVQTTFPYFGYPGWVLQKKQKYRHLMIKDEQVYNEELSAQFARAMRKYKIDIIVHKQTSTTKAVMQYSKVRCNLFHQIPCQYWSLS